MTKAVCITDACIYCWACVNALPEVFAMPVEGNQAMIRGAARVDGRDGANVVEMSPLPDSVVEWHVAIEDAAAGCPVEAIQLKDNA